MRTPENEKRRPCQGGASRQASHRKSEVTISTIPSPTHAPIAFAQRLPPGIEELIRLGHAERAGLGFRLVEGERA